MRIGYQKNEKLITKVLDRLGIQEKQQKLSMRYQILNPLENNDVDYTRSHDCL